MEALKKYKVRFVARGFTQKEGIDYDETFSLVTRYTTIRTIISLDAIFGWKLHQMDVKTTFLNDKIDEEVYIEQLEGFVTHVESLVWAQTGSESLVSEDGWIPS